MKPPLCYPRNSLSPSTKEFLLMLIDPGFLTTTVAELIATQLAFLGASAG